MKRSLLLISAALIMGLSACGEPKPKGPPWESQSILLFSVGEQETRAPLGTIVWAVILTWITFGGSRVVKVITKTDRPAKEDEKDETQ